MTLKSHGKQRKGARRIAKSQVLKIAAAAAALGLTMGIKPTTLLAGDPHEMAVQKQKQHEYIKYEAHKRPLRPRPNAIYMKYGVHKPPVQNRKVNPSNVTVNPPDAAPR